MEILEFDSQYEEQQSDSSEESISPDTSTLGKKLQINEVYTQILSC